MGSILSCAVPFDNDSKCGTASLPHLKKHVIFTDGSIEAAAVVFATGRGPGVGSHLVGGTSSARTTE